MPEIILIRGVPSSGKTTKARTEYLNHILCDTDQSFETDNGYEYDHGKVKEAHEFCYNIARELLMMDLDVFFANAFTHVWETQEYLDLPFQVSVVESTQNLENVHGVPPEIVNRMRQKFEAYPC